PNPPEGRFIALSNLHGFRLKGFILDGKDRVHDLIVLSGPCSGLVLEDNWLQGFKRSGVVTWNCQGRSDKELVTLKGIRTISTKKETDSALIFNANPKINPPVNQFITVQECRFEGPYRKAAVQLASPMLSVEFRHNRFFNNDYGFWYVKTSPRNAIQLTLDSNTFCNVQKIGLHFEGIPLTSSDSKIVIKNNLFAKTAALAQVSEPERMGEASVIFNLASNVCDSSSKEGNFPLRAAALSFTLPTNPTDDAAFLRYP